MGPVLACCRCAAAALWAAPSGRWQHGLAEPLGENTVSDGPGIDGSAGLCHYGELGIVLAANVSLSRPRLRSRRGGVRLDLRHLA